MLRHVAVPVALEYNTRTALQFVSPAVLTGQKFTGTIATLKQASFDVTGGRVRG